MLLTTLSKKHATSPSYPSLQCLYLCNCTGKGYNHNAKSVAGGKAMEQRLESKLIAQKAVAKLLLAKVASTEKLQPYVHAVTSSLDLSTKHQGDKKSHCCWQTIVSLEAQAWVMT